MEQIMTKRKCVQDVVITIFNRSCSGVYFNIAPNSRVRDSFNFSYTLL